MRPGTKTLKEIINTNAEIICKWTTLSTQRIVFYTNNSMIDIPRFQKQIILQKNYLIIFKTTDGSIYGTYNNSNLNENKTDVFNDINHFIFQLNPPMQFKRKEFNDNSFRIFPWKKRSKLVFCVPGAFIISNPQGVIYPYISSYYNGVTWIGRVISISELAIVQCIGKTEIAPITIAPQKSLEEIYKQFENILKSYFNKPVLLRKVVGWNKVMMSSNEFNQTIHSLKGFIVLIQTIDNYVFGSYNEKVPDHKFDNVKDLVDNEHFAFSLIGVSLHHPKKFIRTKKNTRTVRYYPDNQQASIFGIPRFYFMSKEAIQLSYDFSVYYQDVPPEGIELFAVGRKKHLNYIVKPLEVWIIEVIKSSD
ncbi:hypothetical protein ENUP19_0274G0014 [Entamoeba nuttalli]|uniref:TLDc domain-containing protein n=2 Tax=Entamoeba nuttalli TaxID=412467 RepID=K2GYZ3_ENTNP|nr:hypothetical protein ENU1_142100 [Entamoeba nuttalli P19]EKE39082.1 hypothetical protein ENU1_142100 [Entamoeba nuttalli P19]|eukprot:XP_008858577.1 hypothetical protein ENU1_142100 [Entamoeba nuttalli P19]